MGVSDISFSTPDLLCQEDRSYLLDHDDHEVHVDQEDEAKTRINLDLDPRFAAEDGDEYIVNLVQREIDYVPSSSDLSGTTQGLLKSARVDVIKWIFNTRAIFRFQFFTAYLAVTYFDRFFSKRTLNDTKSWLIPLLPKACLILAAKMEEVNPPPQSVYDAQEFEIEDKNKVFHYLELWLLTTLDWKMGSVTSFQYVHYFINRFCGESKPKGLVSRVVELLIDAIKEFNYMNHRPSILAAAAVLVAVDANLTKEAVELKMSPITLWGSPQNEHIFSCYTIMQDLRKRNIKTPQSVVTQNLPSMASSSSNVGTGARRRLTFTTSEQHCPVKKSNTGQS